MQKRKDLLEEIFHLKNPESLPQLTKKLRDVGWDSPEGEVANLTALHIISILNRYLRGTLTEDQVEDWANLVEIREDITFGIYKDEDIIMETIHELANPALEGALTPARAQEYITKLQKE